ncbi:GTA-gp10 family protein [Paenirhodobacter populi]|uniref:Gene transfer agent family protein n=1 Tax=Paenirhodobacter populi TaxID=2306993 RepID=A0A443IQ82_9RHOB|nr:GTA-gp10 family protein [Sinirhodobacter populi]RWR08526.1 gene transfer agent family protein [Sinirhodobacter populi]
MEPITLNWPGGEDEFLLRLGELEALDDLTDDGVLDFRFRLSQGAQRGGLAYSPVKIRHVIACLRLGLIGVGMDRKAAERKARQAFEDGDISELNLTAYMVISHSLKGKDHDPLATTEAAEAPTASDGAGSTETA